MCGTEHRPDAASERLQLPLVGAAAAGCSCCSPAAASPGAAGKTDAGIPGRGGTAVKKTQFTVEGLTCGHCVQTVEKSVSALPGVAHASVHLVAGGRSSLVVAGAVDASAVQKAVSSAGYTFIPASPGLEEEL